jgi:hypothetical protein
MASLSDLVATCIVRGKAARGEMAARADSGATADPVKWHG